MKPLPFLVLPFLLAACSAASSSSEATDDSNVTSSVPASHCEVFVDRAAPHFDSHGVEMLNLYLKTPAGKLATRGGVSEVGFHAQEIAEGQPAGGFKDILASRSTGSADDWEFHFGLASDFSPTRKYVGAFYVAAGDGTRLWLNASEGGRDFVIDTNMIGNLSNLRRPGFFATTTLRPTDFIVVADEFPYLNAARCR